MTILKHARQGNKASASECMLHFRVTRGIYTVHIYHINQYVYSVICGITSVSCETTTCLLGSTFRKFGVCKNKQSSFEGWSSQVLLLLIRYQCWWLQFYTSCYLELFKIRKVFTNPTGADLLKQVSTVSTTSSSVLFGDNLLESHLFALRKKRITLRWS